MQKPPVVTIMGHVDHGKTLLLDAIRNTRVVEGEVGGITQHIGAYKIKTKNGEIVFIDTPGHSAFTAMRARGAKVTDIVVLVIAADDGVMPQTIEAINHAKAASVPIIVAVNKIDLPSSNPDKIRQQVANYGLVDEKWGGDVIFCEVSAKEKRGLDNLLEMILLQAEMLSLSYNPKNKAYGTIIESRIDKGLGPVGSVIVQDGVLKIRDTFAVSSNIGRVRAMIDDMGMRLNEASAGTPVEVLGFSTLPKAGERLSVISKEEADIILKKKKEAQVAFERPKISLEDLFKKIEEGEVKELPLIIRTDVSGTCEALCSSLKELPLNNVGIKILHSGCGGILEQDIMFAKAASGIIIGFHIKPSSAIKALAEKEGVKIYTYDIIYEAIAEIEKAALGLLAPKIKLKGIGKAIVKKIFKIEKKLIAGCFVEGGKIEGGAKVKIIRDGEVIAETSIISLKRFKEDVSFVKAGLDCGIGLSYSDIKEGDVLEAYVALKEEKA
ncbi:MAG: translation initiation factor IF-2 [bacterium]